MEKVIVGIADGKIADAGQNLISYALGSCVGICLYDPSVRIAGMAHVVLPEAEQGIDRGNPYKYAESGINTLIQEMERHGAKRIRLTAKIAGGANMFKGTAGRWEIGTQNVKAVKKTLETVRIPVIAEDTGSNYGRTLLFSGENGSLEISTVRHIKKVI